MKTLNQFAEELKRLGTSFQQVRARYEEVMELCAKRALEQGMIEHFLEMNITI
jgi:hypothetical protein